MRVLVTGSSGLLGARLADRLRWAGVDVVPFDIRLDGADIRDPRNVAAAMSGCDGVFHLAAVSRVAWGEADPALCHEINVDGTQMVLEAAHRSDRRPWVLFASSREVYGNINSVPARETDMLRPFNVYGMSKLEGERLVQNAARQGLRTAIVRLSNVYGGLNDHPDRAVPSLLWRALAGAPLRISGADTFFDFVHVDDCVDGLVSVAERLGARVPLPTLHLVTGVPTSLGDLARLAISIAGSTSVIEIEDARRFDVSGFVGDPANAAAAIGWQARIVLADGLAQYRDELNANGAPPAQVHMPPHIPAIAPSVERTVFRRGVGR